TCRPSRHRRGDDGRRRIPRNRYIACTLPRGGRAMNQRKYRYPTLLLLAVTLIAPMFVTACGKSVGETIDDATITTRVKTTLLNDPDVAGMRIDVDTFKGVVTLSGAVKTPAGRDKAMAVARRVGGVKDVKSTLQINP